MDTLQALKQRIAQATQKDVVHGMFIEHSYTLLAQLKGRQTAEDARQRLLGGKKLVNFFRYPVEDLLKVIELAVPDDASCNQIVERFGANAVNIFFESPVGKTMTMLASAAPHRLLSSAPAGFKATTSFGQRTYKREGEQAGVMEFRQDLLGPAWSTGVFKEALKTACGVDVKVTCTLVGNNPAATEFDLHVTW